jgi:hypothetical protein
MTTTAVTTKRSLRPHWRKMTWAVLIFNVIMVAWVISAATASTGTCQGLSANDCANVGAAAHGIAFTLQLVLWVIGDILLGILWLVTKGRSCPTCGRSVKRGLTICRHCNHNFAR